jgi:toxin LF subunit
MLRGYEAYDLTGIPALHGEVFQAIADAMGCMIASRAVGKYATGLILEGYASKGFHNKAKSCNWGPMAGFVLADPRFTKAPEVAKQAEALRDAVHHGAKEVPVIISEARRRWLLRNNCMRPSSRGSSTHYYFAASPQDGPMLFVLKARVDVAGANGALMWSVHYARAEGRISFTRPDDVQKAARREDYLPVLAMVDPFSALSQHDYRSATTGDYDLFAIFAPAGRYSPGMRDRRMVGHAQLEANIKARLADTGEDAHKGNMTPRIRTIRHLLNAGFRRAGYTGGNMVHHSDEGGRPFVNEVDLPVFAVVPGQAAAYGIENVEDLRAFISVELEGFAPVFNPGWMKQLVFHADPRRAASIQQELRQRFAAPGMGLKPGTPRS